MSTKLHVHILYVLLILAVGMWAYNVGTLTPRVERLSEQDYTQYIIDHNSGCDDIVGHPDTGRLVCEVNMAQEDDALFIIKKTKQERSEGALDSYYKR